MPPFLRVLRNKFVTTVVLMLKLSVYNIIITFIYFFVKTLGEVGEIFVIVYNLFAFLLCKNTIIKISGTIR